MRVDFWKTLLTRVDIAQGGFGVFVRFEYDGYYGALDAFDLHDFLMQDVAELFYARSRNYGNNVTFAFHVINLLDVFDLFEGIYNLRLPGRIDKNVN